ncbi:hypothetical protein SO802_011056 [Lithocarpus litseifolius]|uniref:acetyl-CoA carboxytransferase n=1 Tax=Lithocarpus litseifolius TaxID=425828 RepID=A0AAW2DH71_9ROSI
MGQIGIRMASRSHSPVGTSASEFLRSSSNGVNGIPLRNLGRARFGSTTRRDLVVAAKIRMLKKQDHPWPDDPDPNVKGGVLTHLSYFKPLPEDQKPKPVQNMANKNGLDFSDQLFTLESNYQQALKDLYTHLTPIQRVSIARHPNRPTFLDHVFSITEKFVELHGDRSGYNDPAIVTGIGTIDGRRYMFIGQQKGRNTKENISRNFGMPTPHGYRKALRMMHYTDHHGFPIITFIDTPGACADLKSEELGQGEAIAHNLRTMFGLKVPIISIVIGEGGSGGALAISCANKLIMLETAVFYVARKGTKCGVQNRIAALEQQIKGGLVEAMNSSNLKEKHEELQEEISKAIESLENQNPKEDPPKEDGSLENQNPKEDESLENQNSKEDESTYDE